MQNFSEEDIFLVLWTVPSHYTSPLCCRYDEPKAHQKGHFSDRGLCREAASCFMDLKGDVTGEQGHLAWPSNSKSRVIHNNHASHDGIWRPAKLSDNSACYTLKCEKMIGKIGFTTLPTRSLGNIEQSIIIFGPDNGHAAKSVTYRSELDAQKGPNTLTKFRSLREEYVSFSLPHWSSLEMKP